MEFPPWGQEEQLPNFQSCVFAQPCVDRVVIFVLFQGSQERPQLSYNRFLHFSNDILWSFKEKKKNSIAVHSLSSHWSNIAMSVSRSSLPLLDNRTGTRSGGLHVVLCEAHTTAQFCHLQQAPALVMVSVCGVHYFLPFYESFNAMQAEIWGKIPDQALFAAPESAAYC